ncbi:unnamed protein product [Absidia cylindrospora]
MLHLPSAAAFLFTIKKRKGKKKCSLLHTHTNMCFYYEKITPTRYRYKLIKHEDSVFDEASETSKTKHYYDENLQTYLDTHHITLPPTREWVYVKDQPLDENVKSLSCYNLPSYPPCPLRP